MKIWKSVAKLDNKTWLRYKFLIKILSRMTVFFLVSFLFLILIFKAPEQLEGFAKGLSTIFVFGG